MTDDDYGVIWDDTHPESNPPLKAGDRVTEIVDDTVDGREYDSRIVKVERKRQLPTKFGSVIKAGYSDVKLVRIPQTVGDDVWIRDDGQLFHSAHIGPNWTLVRDGIES